MLHAESLRQVTGGSRMGELVWVEWHTYGQTMEDVERTYQSVSEEKALLESLLEYNHAQLIRSGIAKKIEARASRGAFAHPVDHLTQFRVYSLGDEHEQSIWAALHHRGRMGTSFEIGHRLTSSAGAVTYIPTASDFEEQDIALTGELVDRILGQVHDGNLPHLNPRLNTLIVSGD